MAKRKRKQNNKTEFVVPLSMIITIVVFLMTESISAAVITFFLNIMIFAVIILSVNNARKTKKQKELLQSGIEEIDRMDGIQFEYFLESLFKEMGYRVEVTQAQSDFGADLIMKKDQTKIAVQAKRYLKNVGIKSVQEIAAAKSHYQVQDAWVVTNSFFTKSAVKLAGSTGVRLIDREELIKMILKVKPDSIENAAEVMKKVTPKAVHCPKCDKKMILRNSARGSFYGCSNYPNCKGTKAV